VEKLLTIIKVPEPRGEILFTVLCLVAFLAICRIGFFIPLPIVNQTPWWNKIDCGFHTKILGAWADANDGRLHAYKQGDFSEQFFRIAQPRLRPASGRWSA
jgi:hypothetical protein